MVIFSIKNQSEVKILRINLLCTLCVLFASCSDFSYSGQGKDIPVAGEMELWVDQGDSFVVTQLIEMFQSEYPKSEIIARYAPEAEILKAIDAGICKACILNRNFNEAEIKSIEAKNVKVRSALIGHTSVALVVNKENALKEISLNSLKKLLSGDARSTSDEASGPDLIIPVFDHIGGNNFLSIKNKLLPDLNNMPSHIRSLKSPSAVLEWVAGHKNAMGFVGVNWIADDNDTSGFKYLRRLNILKVEGDSDKNYHYPFQSQIKAKQYPFRQKIYIHDLQGYSGLASGFTAYICSQPGQVLIKKSGLVPAFDHGRTIEIGNN